MANENQVTVGGRLSFPQLTAQVAYTQSQSGSYPAKDVASASPNFMLLLNDTQAEKFKKALIEVFLPFCAEQHKKGEKRSALSPAHIKMILESIEDPENAVVNTPFKKINDKTLALAPDTVSAIKCIGNKGVDLDLKAIVHKESELVIPDPDILAWPTLVDLDRTRHQLYAGCNAGATIGFYTYVAGKSPGVSAGVNTLVFRGDNTKFGGGVDIDLDEIFMD
ncbi:MAG: hypothetical protein ACOYB3_02120 [Azonexus sp.]